MAYTQVTRDTSNYEYDSQGRITGKKDTTNQTLQHRDKYEDSITISFHYWDSTRNNKIDSSIDDFYTRFPVSWKYYDMGNFGSAAKSYVFQPLMRPGFDAGFHAYDVYMYTPENTRFFQTTRPYSETAYLLGSRAEQMINLFHTQNRKSNFNIGLDFRVINSPGTYRNQSTNISNTRVNTFFQTSNKRYTNNIIFIANKILSSENGGIQPNQNVDSLFMNNPTSALTKLGSALLTTRSIFGVTVGIGTQYNDLTFVLRHSYDFGQKDSIVTDSSTIKLFYPRLRFQHTLQYSNKRYEYHDNALEPSDYSNFMQYTVFPFTTDSLKFNDSWQTLTNDLAIISYPQKNNLNQFLKLNAGYENIKGQTYLATQYNNIYTAAEYRNRTRNQLYDIEAAGKLYVTGYYAGDYSAYISFMRSLKKNIGSIQVGFQNVNRTPSFIMSEYNTYASGDRYSLSSFPSYPGESFKKENITRIFAVVNVPPAALQLTGDYYLVTNLAYFSGLYTPAQASSVFNVLNIGAYKKIKVAKHLNWYLQGNVQQIAGNAPVNVPLVLGRTRFAFEGNFFKNLFLSTGFEVRYNTPYKADDYSPLNGQFVYQDTSTITNRPDVDIYLNMRIKGFKGFVRLENLNTVDFANGFAFTKYNYSAPGYPERGLWLRIGIWWSFVN
ncbi:Putative porin [Parafilimonas terrae]|uniref:Putative porin n=2 Tax=Parafilimonas terrae TaxID=1465490 RepID=A0A1I5UUV8_9BACT|nr:Putative porin [Parafilimonas terrae]